MSTTLQSQPTTVPNNKDTSVSPEVAGAVGKGIDRVTGHAKVTGKATYAAEWQPANVVHALLVQSTIAKGQLSTLDVSAAEKAVGVLAVITPGNMIKLSEARGGMSGETRSPLSDMNIHFAGQTIAVIVADTIERARAAAATIKIEFKSESPVVGLGDSRAKQVKPKTHNGAELQYERGDVSKAVSDPSLVVIRATYKVPTETHNPMEMSATVAAWEGTDKLTVWDASQGVVGARASLASAFGLKPEAVRVLCPYVGGGFGCKGAFWPHTLMCAVAAKVVGKPVRLMLTREQMFTSCGHRPELEQKLVLAADKSGKIVAARHDTSMHGSAFSNFVESTAVGTTAVMYDIPNFGMTHTVEQVNIAPPTFMRAPGEAPGTFAIESAMDELACALHMDPLEFRLKNYAEHDPMEGKPYSSKLLRECYALGAEKFGWSKRNAMVGSMNAPDGRRIGWGMATAIYPALTFPAQARIRLMIDGGGVRAISGSATQDLGTGMWTVGHQMTASLVGLPIEKVKFELGDTNLPPASVSGGSSSTASVGQALSEASLFLRFALLKLVDGKSPLANVKASEVALRGEKLVLSADESKSESIVDLIRKSGRAYVEGATVQSRLDQRRQLGEVTGEDFDANAKKFAFHSFGAHFVEVMIGESIPAVHVNRVVSVMHIGRVVNPKLARSQVLGGAVMGIGAALMEETIYDVRTGKPVNASLADYLVCVNPDVNQMEAYFIDEPDARFNAIGCRGVGEIGITGTAAAVANAVYHATGKRIRDLPITPDKLL